jgi:hypothetical protein
MSRSSNILIAATFALAGTGALAADDGVKASRKQAKDTYNMDRKACTALAGDERKNCLNRAKAQYDQQIAEVRKSKKANKAEDDAAKAQERDAKKHSRAHSGGDRSYRESSARDMQRPAPGAQSDLSQPTAKHEPLGGMGKAPESASSPSASK